MGAVGSAETAGRAGDGARTVTQVSGDLTHTPHLRQLRLKRHTKKRNINNERKNNKCQVNTDNFNVHHKAI